MYYTYVRTRGQLRALHRDLPVGSVIEGIIKGNLKFLSDAISNFLMAERNQKPVVKLVDPKMHVLRAYRHLDDAVNDYPAALELHPDAKLVHADAISLHNLYHVYIAESPRDSLPHSLLEKAISHAITLWDGGNQRVEIVTGSPAEIVGVFLRAGEDE